MAQRVKHLPAVQDTWVLSLSWEDPLEKEMATHSSILAWKIPWREEPGRLHRLTKNWTRLSDFTFTFHFLLELFHVQILLHFCLVSQETVCVYVHVCMCVCVCVCVCVYMHTRWSYLGFVRLPSPGKCLFITSGLKGSVTLEEEYRQEN